LDREQKAIMEDDSRGLGLRGDWEGIENWYGGRVQQIAQLEQKNSTDAIAIRLEPMEKRTSNRFARFLGSRRILRLRIPKDLAKKKEVHEFLCQKFVLCGRTFVPFLAKEGVHMVETSENYERCTDETCGDQYRLSFQEFVEWHNPLNKKNIEQVCISQNFGCLCH
jgi:hypothetical protein